MRTITEIYHFENGVDEKVSKALTEEILDKDSIIRLSQKDVEEFLSYRGDLIKVKSCGDPIEAITSVFETIKHEEHETYNVKSLLANLVCSKDIKIQDQITTINELSKQFEFFSNMSKILWALTVKEQQAPICLTLYAIFK